MVLIEPEETTMGTTCTTNTACCATSRNFPTKEERVEMLNEYRESLEKEIQGVKEKIKELEKN